VYKVLYEVLYVGESVNAPPRPAPDPLQRSAMDGGGGKKARAALAELGGRSDANAGAGVQLEAEKQDRQRSQS
jgi:hypothetical protein